MKFTGKDEDVRGQRWNFQDNENLISLFEIKKGFSRGGQYHKNEVTHVLISGKIEYIIELNYSESSWHLFVIKVSNRDELYQKLKRKGISTSVHFIPIHKHPYYRERFSYNDKDYPIANAIFKQSWRCSGF